MSHVIDNVTHYVTDDDGVFIIDPATREITYTRSATAEFFDLPVIVKGDHNSERLTFRIPKIIEGHDMRDCDVVRIHYIVTDLTSPASDKAFYDVPEEDIDDETVDGTEYVKFSWLIGRRLTQFAGRISFVVQFACTTSTTTEVTKTDENGEEVKETITTVSYKYSLSTKPYGELTVSDAIVATDKQAADDFVSEYETIVQEWYNNLENRIAEAKADLAKAINESNNSNIKDIKTVPSSEDGGTNTVTIEFNDPDREPTVFGIQNGSQGLSAYQVAVKNGFEGTEQEWLSKLGYDECLKGVTLTKDEYDSLSEDEKNKDFIYIIKNADTEADYATTAGSATNASNAEFAQVASGYVMGGTIDKALESKVTADTLNKIVCGSVEAVDIIGNGSVLIDYRTIVTGINKSDGTYYEISGTPSKTITAPDKCIFTSVEITSCSIDNKYSTRSAVISEDGKTITFSIDGEVPTHTGSTRTATIEYSYTWRAEDIDSVYHAQTAITAITAITADRLKLENPADGYTLYKTDAISVNVSLGRAYLLSLALYDGKYYTAVIYINSDESENCSTPFSGRADSNGGYIPNMVCRIWKGSVDIDYPDGWRAIVSTPDGATYGIGNITFIEF